MAVVELKGHKVTLTYYIDVDPHLTIPTLEALEWARWNDILGHSLDDIDIQSVMELRHRK